MKAIEILECLCYMGEDSELFSIIDIDGETIEERQEFCENYFGEKMVDRFPSGKYFYYWTRENLQILENGKCGFVPDSFILTGEYTSYGVPEAINFYRIED